MAKSLEKAIIHSKENIEASGRGFKSRRNYLTFVKSQRTSRNLLGFVAPWKDPSGKTLGPLEIIMSRRITITYLILVWGYIFFIVEAQEGDRLYTMKEFFYQFDRMDSNELIPNSVGFLFTLFTAPFSHWDRVHAIYVTGGVLFFIQSFEAHNNWKHCAIIFIGTSATTSFLFSIFFNVGFSIYPDVEMFAHVMGRTFKGGSIGMFGTLGALSYHAKRPQYLLILVFMFEVWNYTSFGTDGAISLGHATSMLIGWSTWRWWNRKGEQYDESE